MALVKFYNGSTENLDNLPIKEGQIIFSVSNSNGSIYYDSSNSSRIKMTALADRAIADNLGNNIGNTYISNLTGTTSKTNYVITPKTASGNNKTAITIPAASSTIAGLMTTESQSFSGNKTFNQSVTFLGSADASLGSYTYPAVTIGPYSSTHLEIDANEIMAKANASTSSELYLNDEGGIVVIGPGGMNIKGHITAGATTRTLDIGSTNNYFRNVYGTNFYGTATNASQLTSNDVLSYTSNTVRYFNIHSPVGVAADANNIPTNTWWHILRFIRADGDKYYTDLAIPFADNSIYYKRIVQGEVTNTSNTALKGWFKLLDSNNYTNYTVTKTGSGASGTWSINVTGNAGTATKLQTARTIRTNLSSTSTASFNGTANITPGITGTLAVSHGGTGATTAADARSNLGITPANIGAAATSHNHSASGITSGTLPIARGGTGATTAANARTNLGAAASNHSHSVVTTSANGFMSAADKSKLNGIATNANNYVHPTSAGYKHIPSGGSGGQILRWSSSGTAVWDRRKIYSTSEVDTGNNWIDGKRIYRISGEYTGTIVNGGFTNIPLKISGKIDTVIHANVFSKAINTSNPNYYSYFAIAYWNGDPHAMSFLIVDCARDHYDYPMLRLITTGSMDTTGKTAIYTVEYTKV